METHIDNYNKPSKHIVHVLAILCQIHNVDMEELSSIVKNKQDFNDYELWMSEQLSKEMVKGEVTICSEDTLECGPDAVDESQLSEMDESYDDNDDSDNQDEDYNPSPPKKALVIASNLSPHKFEKAWRDWTKQKDSTKPTDYNWNNFLGKGKKRSMDKIAKYYHFNHDPHLKSLKRWAERKNRGIISKRELNKIVYEQFLDHRSNKRIVTDRMLRLWAMKQRNQLGTEIAEKFVASQTWLLNFKRRFNIVSRSITHKVGKNWFNDEAKKANLREKFLEEVKEVMRMEDYDLHVINIDQSRFDKEIHGNRTLNIRGAKQVHSQMGSKNATTHSYMIMPMASMSGRLMELLYVKSQEAHSSTKGYHFPDNTIIPPGIVAFPGSSAMMNNYINMI